MEAIDSFEQWKEFLSRNVNIAREAGMSQGAMVDAATRIGEFLARNVDPKNREQRLLSEMWKVADEEEKRAIASTITKMVGDGQRH
ncbi:DUF3243 domain-containing protein [Caldinitratiruptor microaerophilus]|uniref:DUF3243 domain-containing protein n=1 Tax=Caldinitratiruptor microaerophilus TaxID=671077 RepID=A0AA35G679_9FIRM|nr:DUF3243 domain-containing protein [Caldinitratiruptor microaerophilus]BDG60856.1 hypothetical protein caldi_19460 [Caldinitratiruptor microaerophilus]